MHVVLVKISTLSFTRMRFVAWYLSSLYTHNNFTFSVGHLNDEQELRLDDEFQSKMPWYATNVYLVDTALNIFALTYLVFAQI